MSQPWGTIVFDKPNISHGPKRTMLCVKIIPSQMPKSNSSLHHIVKMRFADTSLTIMTTEKGNEKILNLVINYHW